MASSRTTRTTSAYFQNHEASSASSTIHPWPSGRGRKRPAADQDGQHSYAASIASDGLSVPRPSTTRPSTASGRKSRTTMASSITGHTDSENIICAVTEARGVSPSVGLAFVNISTVEVTLSQICDDQSYVKTIHEISMLSPSKVLFPATVCPPNKPSTLSSLVEGRLPDVQICSQDRSAWSETSGLDYIQTLAFREDIEPLKVAISGKYYAISSFAATMKYIEQHCGFSFAPHSCRIRYQPSEVTMMIDISAIQYLEIIHNLRNPKSKDCLFGLLNQTLTPMGSRMLRSNILQPPTKEKPVISERHEALDDLISNEEMFREIRKALKPFNDVEKLLTKLIIVPSSADDQHADDRIDQVLIIKSFLESIPGLYTALGPATSNLLVRKRDLCRPEVTGRLLYTIHRTIQASVTYTKAPLDLRNQRTFAVKDGIDGMLDVSRQTYKELVEHVHQHVEELQKIYHMEVKLKYDNGRKYWLCLKIANLDDRPLPPVLINIVKKKDRIECQTLDLVKMNTHLSDAYHDIARMSDGVVKKLLDQIRLEFSTLSRVCESVAEIDMISSFGQLATTRDYVRPEIGETLALRSARHPILDKMMDDGFVPNDYFATEQYRFHTVTGCNMSGKSTYIRAIALLQIMAQIGSFVPAEYAAFPIIHNIFARVSMDDSIENNLSTFSVEMREMAFVLRNVNDKSLVIIDELGRGTSSLDGLAISCAMAEALIQSKASVWFATHFTELARALADRPYVLNLHLASNSSTTRDGLPQITMLYKATSGALDDKEFYGINLARAVGLPQAFIDKAEEVAKDLRSKKEANRQKSEFSKLLARRQLLLGLHDALKLARESGREETLRGYLKRLRDEFILRMHELVH